MVFKLICPECGFAFSCICTDDLTEEKASTQHMDMPKVYGRLQK